MNYRFSKILNDINKVKSFHLFETTDFLPSIYNRYKKPIYVKKLNIKKSKIDYYEQYETTDIKK